MSNKLKLSAKHIDALTALPENGMGFHGVDLILKDGFILEERIVLNSTYLKLNEVDNINVSDISKVTIHENATNVKRKK